MKHCFFKKLFAVISAAVCCVNAFAITMPIFPYEVPKAWDYKQNKWMEKIPNNTPLNRISMVSSHDSGMDKNSYPYPHPLFAAQYYNIYQQAMYGVRFFDLRIQDLKGGYYSYHGQGAFKQRGILLGHIFDQAVKFLKENDSEVLIFKMSHWYSEGEMKAILKYIENNSEWTEVFYKTPNDSSLPPILNRVPLGDVRGKLIVVVEDTIPAFKVLPDARANRLAKEFGFTPSKGFWQFADLAGKSIGRYGFFSLYDSYSDTIYYDKMRDDQAKKFDNFLNSDDFDKESDAFLYCWQLTYGHVSDRAAHCNPHLDTELNTIILKQHNRRPNLVNLDFVDSRICNVVINTNADLCAQDPVLYISTRDDGTSSHKVIEEYRYRNVYYLINESHDDVYYFTNGWYVIDGNVDLRKGAKVMGEDVNIILKDGCNLTITGDGVPGIRIDESHYNLHIYAQSKDRSTMGKMTVSASKHNAAIGGSENRSGENINIHGGYITATGGPGAAAIGGGYAGCGNNIRIYGGIVKAKSSSNAAAIGGGVYNYGGAVGKNITIFGGDVEADASTDATRAAGIGGGWGGDGQNIVIYGGKVSAIGTENGAGIGGGERWSGNSGRGEYIEIHGGEVYAKGGSAIGGGKGSNGEHIEITGGKVTAVAHGDGHSAAIGGGHGGSGENISISGGYIVVTGGPSGAGIGGGCYNGGGAGAHNITISGGTIEISNINNAYSIGSANDGSASNIVIKGGSIWANSGKGVENPTDGGSKTVYEVTVPDCGTGDTPMQLSGFLSYGTKDLYPRYEKLKLWLPNGPYSFSSEKNKYYVYVNSEATYATITCTSIEVVVGPTGYTSIYSDKKLVVPANVQVYAYVAKYGTEELLPVLIGENEVLPANHGYIVKAKEGTYRFFPSSETAVSVESVLTGTTRDIPASDFYPGKEKYGLGNVNGKTAFYKYTDNTIKAGKAYFVK